jgi:hypothetical protein
MYSMPAQHTHALHTNQTHTQVQVTLVQDACAKELNDLFTQNEEAHKAAYKGLIFDLDAQMSRYPNAPFVPCGRVSEPFIEAGSCPEEVLSPVCASHVLQQSARNLV